MPYTTADNVKAKLPALALTLSDDDIIALIASADSIVDGAYDRAPGYYADTDNFPDGVSATVRSASEYVVGFLLRFTSSAGLDNQRVGDSSWGIEAPDIIRQRLRLILYSVNQHWAGVPSSTECA